MIVNAHVTNAAPLRCALEVLRSRHDGLMVAILDAGSLSPRVERAFRSDAGDWHANAAETSLMMALEPRLVRPGRIGEADDPDRTAGLVLRPSRQPDEPERDDRLALAGEGLGRPPALRLDGGRRLRNRPAGAAGGSPARRPVPPPDRFLSMKSDTEILQLQAELKARGVKYCVGAYVDIHGVPKGKFVPIDHLLHCAHGSELYTGYALDGLGQSPNDDEISSVPDLDAMTILPWRPEVAWMPADNALHGRPYRSAPAWR